MKTKVILLAGLVVPCLLTGCAVVEVFHHKEVVTAPPLPALVTLGAEPYVVRDGFHYRYKGGDWYYARSMRGPWLMLPREHYPKEVRFSDGGPRKDVRHEP